MALSKAERTRLDELRRIKTTRPLGYAERAEFADLQVKERMFAAPSVTVSPPSSAPSQDYRKNRNMPDEDRFNTGTSVAPAPPPPPVKSAAVRTPVPAPRPAGGGAGAAGGAAGGTGARGGAVSAKGAGSKDIAGILAEANEKYGYLSWAFNDPELGPLWARSQQEGWDANRWRGELFKTRWFRNHGLQNATAELRKVSDSYLLPLGGEALKDYAYKVATGELQAAEFRNLMKEQAKGLWGDFGGALDRGLTIETVADSYRQRIAQELDVAPQSVDFRDAKWQRLISRRDPETNRIVNPTISDAVVEVRTSREYGWDFSPTGRQARARLYADLAQEFGMVA